MFNCKSTSQFIGSCANVKALACVSRRGTLPFQLQSPAIKTWSVRLRRSIEADIQTSISTSTTLLAHVIPKRAFEAIIMSDDEADPELLELFRQSLGISNVPQDEVSSDTGRC